MRKYAYVTKGQTLPEPESRSSSPKKKSWRERRGSLFLIIAGLFLLGTAGWPVIEWQIIGAHEDVSQGSLMKPVVETTGSQPARETEQRVSQFGQLLMPADLGTLDKPPAPFGGFDKRAFINEFFVTIPEVGIERARVKVDSETFDDWLALYPGSALPGEQGNVFISGHSVLPKFYDPDNYKTIFSTIHNLEQGDKIIAEVEGVEYTYVIKSKRIVDPKDVSVIKPPAEGRYLSLLTCNPPGTVLKRLIILAELA